MGRTRSNYQSIQNDETYQRIRAEATYTYLKIRHLQRLHAAKIISKYLYKHFIKPRRAMKWQQNPFYQFIIIN
jgi:hypothetical protein